MNYDTVGSGAGKKRIKDEEGSFVHYAGSDSLLTDDDYKNFPDLHMLPSAAGLVFLDYFYFY